MNKMRNNKNVDKIIGGGYKNFISLGHFCSVAQDIERLGLRSKSYPFDWIISDFEKNIELIENHFYNFIDEDSLEQNIEIPFHYRNSYYKIGFYHDFNRYETIKEQLPKVEKKYSRRISNFYKAIQEPTVFFRYIYNEKECSFIQANQFRINEILTTYNELNTVIYIANIELRKCLTDIDNVFYVDPDENDSLARKPLYKNDDIYRILRNVKYPDREKNLMFYTKKTIEHDQLINKIKRKFIKFYLLLKHGSYTHDKQYKGHPIQ